MATVPFSINITVNIEPPEVKQQVEDVADRLYGNDRGTDESKEEFLARITERWLLSWFSVESANQAAHASSQAVLEDIKANATIRQRKDKPEPKPDTQPVSQ